MYAIWHEMTEKDNNLLAVFEDRVNELYRLCNDRKRRIEELEATLIEKDDALLKANQDIETFQTKCKNLLTARKLEANEIEFQEARKRVNKLVREVDTCIALLNE